MEIKGFENIRKLRRKFMLCQDLTLYNESTFVSENVYNETFVHEIECFNKIGLLYTYICQGESKTYFQIFDNMFEYLSSESKHINIIQWGIYHTVNSMLMLYINKNILLSKGQYHIKFDLFTQIDTFKSWDEAVKYLKSISKSIFDISEENQNITIDTVNTVKSIISTHLQDDLSLSKLAEMVYLNPSYLSRIFKNITGLNVSVYIKKMRVKKAEQLLLHSQKEIQDISCLIGFSSPSYFIRFFKQCVGLTPSQYRTAYAAYLTAVKDE
jgi:two-component system response regulator YesN